MPNNQLTLSADLVVTGGAQADAAAQSLQRLIDVSQRVGSAGAHAGQETAESFGHVIPATTAASAAMRALEGNLQNNVRAAERFLTTTLKMGDVLQAAFPVVGAAALGGAIIELGGKVADFFKTINAAPGRITSGFLELQNPLRSANAELALSNITTENLIAKLEHKPQNHLAEALAEAAVQANKLSDSFDKSLTSLNTLLKQESFADIDALLRGRTGTDDLSTEMEKFQRKVQLAFGDKGKISELLTPEIKKMQGLNEAAQAKVNGGGLGSLVGEDRAGLTAGIVHTLTMMQDNLSLTAKADKLGPQKAAAQDNAAQITKANELKAQVDAYAKSARDYGLGPVSLAIQKRNDMLAQPGLTSAERATINEAGALEIARALARIAQDNSTEMVRAASYGLGRGDATGRVGADYANMPANDFTALVAAFGGPLKMSSALNDRIAASLDKLYSAGGTGIEKENSEAARTVLSDFTRAIEDNRAGIRGSDRDAIAANADKANQAIQRLSIGARPEDAARIANETLAIRNQQFEADRAILDSDIAAYGTAQQRAELAKLQGDLDNKAYDASEAHFRSMQEIIAKQAEQARAFSGALFDSILGGSHGIENFIKSQVTGVGRTIFQNATKGEMKKIAASLPHASDPNSTIGKLLAGTPFGATKLDTAGDKLIMAGDALLAAANGGSTANGSRYSSTVGLPGGITSGNVAAIVSAASPMFKGMVDGIPTSPAAGWPTLTDPMAGIKPDLPSPMISTAQKVAAGIGVAGGGLAAYQGFSSGGVRGAIEGAAGVIGAATSALSLAKGIASSIPIIGAVATTVLGLAGSFLPDPKTERANAISKELQDVIYHAPTAINKMVDSGGLYMDRDSMGNLRTSPFSGNPITTNPYTTWNNGTPYEIPGQTISPYTPAPQPQTTVIVQHHYHEGAFQMIDGANLRDHLVANHEAVGEAAAANLSSGDTALVRRIQYVQR